MKTQVFALHGFLGLPSDWESIFKALKTVQPTWELIAVDLRETKLGPELNLKKWAVEFNQWAADKGPADHRVLLGYSMGGRLGLQALLADKAQWNCGILLSVHPGLQALDEVEMRLRSDKHWAQRFLTEPFENVISEWNHQPIFSGADKEPPRIGKDYSSEFLEKCLTNWSLSKQENLREKIYNSSVPQMWLAGERDVKFSRMVKEMEAEKGSANSSLICEIVPGASHRILFDQPKLLARIIAEFAAQ